MFFFFRLLDSLLGKYLLFKSKQFKCDQSRTREDGFTHMSNMGNNNAKKSLPGLFQLTHFIHNFTNMYLLKCHRYKLE